MKNRNLKDIESGKIKKTPGKNCSLKIQIGFVPTDVQSSTFQMHELQQRPLKKI